MTFRHSAIWKRYPESERHLKGIRTYGRLFTGARWMAVLGLLITLSTIPSLAGMLAGLLVSSAAVRLGIWASAKGRRCEERALEVDACLNELADIFEISTAKLVAMKSGELSNKAINLLSQSICEAEVVRSEMRASRPWLRPVGLNRKSRAIELKLGKAEMLLLEFQVIESGTVGDLTLVLLGQRLSSELVSA